MSFSWDVYRIGSLAEESDGYTYTLYSQYDALGRVTQSQVALNSQNYTIQYSLQSGGIVDERDVSVGARGEYNL